MRDQRGTTPRNPGTDLATSQRYAEICGLCGWSYTKLNRLLAEGRAALRARRRGG